MGLFYPVAKKQYHHYIRRKKYTQIQTTLTQLYQNINPFQICSDARLAYNMERSELLYGEINFCALLDLLALIQPQPNDVFYDLGSGCGKTLLAVKLHYPKLRVIGIEILPPLHELANQKITEYRHSKGLKPQDFEITLICDNLLNQQLIDPNIIFINSTSFSTVTWKQIVQKLMTVQEGTKIIVTSKQLPKRFFKILFTGMEQMSWGLTSTYIYEKLS